MKYFLLLIIVAFSIEVSGQRQTYYGFGLGAISATTYPSAFPDHINSNYLLDGALLDAFLRQEISETFSFMFGYSRRPFGNEFKVFNDTYVDDCQNFDADQITMDLLVNVDIIKDVFSGYASFGFLYCINESPRTYPNSVYTISNERINYDWKYLPESNHTTRYSLGIGCRYNLFDELYLECEIGYQFRVKDLREYIFTIVDDQGNSLETQSIMSKGNYCLAKFGLSYSLQKTIEGMKIGLAAVSSVLSD